MPPNDNYTAGIVLNRMCHFLLEEGHEICCYTIKDPSVCAEIPSDKKSKIPYRTEPMPPENYGRRSRTRRWKKSLNFFRSLIMNNFSAIAFFPHIAKRVSDFAIEQNAQMIWGIVQGHSTIRIFRQVTVLTRLPYVVQAWDPSEWYLSFYGFDRFTMALIMKVYSSLLKRSTAFIASSWAMAEEYTKKYGVKSFAVLPGLEESRISVAERKKSKKDFIIAFAGQMYAINEIKCLLETTKNLLCDKHIRIRIYGKDWQYDLSNYPHVEIMGWISQANLLEELSDADLLYCPYGFEKSFEKTAKLSFPSKLVCYLKTGRPVLFHGPHYSSPGIFLKKHNAAYICDSLDSVILANLISSIINDQNKEAIAQNGFNTFKKYLTLETMKKNFLAALNIS